MGRPPSNGTPAFRFSQSEVVEMETILQEHHNQMPAREVLVALAEKFSASAERLGKLEVQMKQVWNWFQNRRYAVRAKAVKVPEKLSVTPMPPHDSTAVRIVPQSAHSLTAPSVQSLGRPVSDHSQMEFEAKSARDGAWYDVTMFLSHRSLETGDADVLVRFAGFGAEEDEWISVRKHVRQRSLPCEPSECVAVLPGDLTLCFQEGKEQALYFDAHVLDAQRRRHDVRGCRCRFLVRYDHDQSEEIVPLRKVCRRPETDYRLQQLHAKKDLGPVNQQKTGADPNTCNTLRVYPPIEKMKKQQHKAEVISDAVSLGVPPTSLGNVNVTIEAKVLQPKTTEITSSGDVGTSVVQTGANVAVTSSATTSIVASSSAQNIPPKTIEIVSSGDVGTSVVPPGANDAVTSGAVRSTLTSGSGENTQPKATQRISSGVVRTPVPLVPPGFDVAVTIGAATSTFTSVSGENIPPKTTKIISSCDVGTSVVLPEANVAVTGGPATSTVTIESGQNIPPKTTEMVSSGDVGTSVVPPGAHVA